MSDDNDPTRVTIERMNALSVAFAQWCIEHKVAGIELPLVIANALSSNGIDLKEFATALGWAYQQILQRKGVVVEVGQPASEQGGVVAHSNQEARKTHNTSHGAVEAVRGAGLSNVVPMRRPVGLA